MSYRPKKQSHPKPDTTDHRIVQLYHLIEAVQDELTHEEQDYATDIVINILKSGKARMINTIHLQEVINA